MNKLAAGLGAALALGICATAANAQTRTWVSGTGNDINPCSRTAPCATFSGAISKTSAGGEIDCLDAGNFGTVTITKEITIDCAGVTGGITIGGAIGVTVNTGPTDKVVLRNLNIQGPTGIHGVHYIAGGHLLLDNVRINAFTGTGINVQTTAGGNLYIRDTQISNVTRGIKVVNSGGAFTLQMDRSRIDRTGFNGIELASTNVTASITNSALADLLLAGLLVSAVAFANLDNNIITGNSTGVNVNVAGGSIRISNNSFENNTTAIVFSNGGTVSGNNTNTVIGSPGSLLNGGSIPFF